MIHAALPLDEVVATQNQALLERLRRSLNGFDLDLLAGQIAYPLSPV